MFIGPVIELPSQPVDQLVVSSVLALNSSSKIECQLPGSPIGPDASVVGAAGLAGALEPLKPLEPVEPLEPLDPPAPLEPLEPLSSDSTEPLEAVEPVEPVGPAARVTPAPDFGFACVCGEAVVPLAAPSGRIRLTVTARFGATWRAVARITSVCLGTASWTVTVARR